SHLELEPVITTDNDLNNSKYDYPENLGGNPESTTSYEDNLNLLKGCANIEKDSMFSLEERFSMLQILLDKGLITKEDYEKKKKELLDLL
ncbi:MAG: SHOCT domain-containing protein, partial [Clostridiaceae bacterium]|nr:SHOCT domain-containing protein [Clostridiaceae bacterium]